MAKRLQLRGGTTTEHSTFTGAVREVTVDTDKDTLVVHDAVTTGGFPVVSNKTTTTADMSFVVDEDNMVSDLSTKVPTQQSVKAYVSTEISSALASEMSYKGGYNAATNTPNLDAASPVAIAVGDVYTVTVAGTFFTVSVDIGDMVIAEVNSPTLETEWTKVDNGSDSAANIKTKYESNADTNAYTDAEKTQAALQTGTNTGDNAGVTSVAGTSPIVSSGGTAPTLSHSTAAGNKHIPTGGSVGQVLKNTASGTVTWQADTNTNTTYSVGDGGLTEINFTTADNTKLDGIEPGSTADQTAAQLLTAVRTVDGAGSGLDADLLDGVQGASYAKLASPVLTGTPTAPTQASGNNTTRLATTAFVTTATSGGIAAGSVGTTELAANAVTAAKLPNLVASTDYSITFIGTIAASGLTKESELKIARSGTVTIRGKMNASYSGKVAPYTYWRLYKNGVGQGSTYNIYKRGTHISTQNLTVAAGDLIQAYAYTQDTSQVSATIELQVGFTGYLTGATHIV